MNKTQFLNISRTSSVFPFVIIDSITTVPCNNVKNLGFIFDYKLNFSDQIANVCKSTNYQLYKIRSIRKFLPFISGLTRTRFRVSIPGSSKIS